MISEETKQQLFSDDSGQRQFAAKKLAKKMSAEARQLIIARLQEEQDPEVLEWLLIGARYAYAFEAVDRVLTLLNHPVGDVRGYVCGALENIGDERAVENLQRIGSNDQDYQVRFAAIEALESIGIKEPKAANVALLALDQIRQVHQLKPSSAMIQDLTKAAITASVVVQKALKEKPPPSLPFDVGDLGRTEVGRNTKTKVLNQIATQLRRSGVAPSENDYVVSVVRSIIRRSNVVRMRKSQGVTACELCDEAFFESKSGKLYCQVAHITALKDGGRDSMDNTLLLCANCHAQLDMGLKTEVTNENGRLKITLPSKVQQIFELIEGKAPCRIQEEKITNGVSYK